MGCQPRCDVTYIRTVVGRRRRDRVLLCRLDDHGNIEHVQGPTWCADILTPKINKLCIGQMNKHSRQLLKMLRRDTVVGGMAVTSKNALPHPLLLLRIHVHSNDIENHHIFTLSNTCSLLTITQLIITIATCILLTYIT